MSGRITSKSSNRLQIDTKHIWAQLIASKTKFPKSSASNRTTMIGSGFRERHQRREMGYETLRGRHGFCGFRGRGHGLVAGQIIGNGLEFVGLREETPQNRIDARIVPGETEKFCLDAAMRF